MLLQTLVSMLLWGRHSCTTLQVEVDYSDLALDAESHKHDILNFLKDGRVRKQYKALYDSLLAKLVDDFSMLNQSRRGQDSIPNETRRIVYGRNTSIAAVPWQVSLRERTYPICGGSVLTDLWLLTAAHCLMRAHSADLSVRLGSSWKTHGGEMYDVKASFVHPRYNSKTKTNDVGLVQLYSQLRFSAKILPIKLVDKDMKLFANSPAIVSGWGKLKEGGPSATYLQSSTIKTIAMKLCKRSGLDRKAIDPQSMFCAGSFVQPSPDACQGDSGGPIVYDGVLIGVVSWGLGCARGNFPGVYTRLGSPIVWDWVHSHIGNKDANTTQVFTPATSKIKPKQTALIKAEPNPTAVSQFESNRTALRQVKPGRTRLSRTKPGYHPGKYNRIKHRYRPSLYGSFRDSPYHPLSHQA